MIRITLLLVTVLIRPPGPPVVEETIALRIVGTANQDVQAGVQLGVEEMDQTTRLLGREVRLASRDAAEYDAVIVASGALRGGSRPAVHLRGLPPGAGRCDVSIASPDDEGVLWHPSLDRFGASELNERFMRRHHRPMEADAYAGWLAVKALVESALRRGPDEDPCAALLRLRLDGHKGRPLFFDPAARQLVQPVYVVRNGKVMGERR